MAFRKIIFYVTLFTLGMLWLASPSQAQNGAMARSVAPPKAVPPVSGYAIKAHQIDGLLKTLYNNNQFNGSVAVLEKGQVVYHKAFGWANRKKQDTLNTQTPFRLASVSKQFTAMAIMILKEKGKLKYEDDIRKYLPELPYKGISIRNLLHHNSGLPDYLNSIATSVVKFYPNRKLISNEDLVKYYSTRKPKLNFKPGKKAAYSNTGYAFLASIVERVSGKSFGIFLEDHIFKPLAMNQAYVYNTRNFDTYVTQDTIVDRQDTVLVSYNEIRIERSQRVVTNIKTVEKKRAFGYYLSYNGTILMDYHPFDGIAGSKSICVSTEDLIKWDQALHKNVLVSANTLKEAFTPSKISNKKNYGYGYGWKILSEDPNIVFHHGLYRGFRTCIHRDLKNKRTIILLCNRQIGGRMNPILFAVESIMKGKKYKAPEPTKTETKTLAQYKKSFWINY